ncbi:MAG TPA: addiction module protein [Lentisphaeria bacterium]|nr:MAG: addiction module protein [Lentisphaerae bacterium GWF2_50_93]HCE43673.1 addiction module protein [Lentisphaeria bacterium]
MNSSIITEALKYDVPERILIVEDIWDSIASIPEALPITDAQKKELDRRLEAYHSDPKKGIPWEEVKKRIKSGKKRNASNLSLA